MAHRQTFDLRDTPNSSSSFHHNHSAATTGASALPVGDTTNVLPLQPGNDPHFSRKQFQGHNPSDEHRAVGAGVTSNQRQQQQERFVRKRVHHEPKTSIMGHEPSAEEEAEAQRRRLKAVPVPDGIAKHHHEEREERRHKAMVAGPACAMENEAEGVLPNRLGGKAQIVPPSHAEPEAPAPDAAYRPRAPWNTDE